MIDLWYAAFIDRVISDIGSASESEKMTADLVYALSGILWVAVYLVSIAGFLVWLFRVRANAESLAPDGHRHTRPWLIFGWVVPIISFWFPKQIVDDIWHASARDGEQASPQVLIDVWWAAWVAGSLVANVAARLLATALFAGDDLESVAFAARFDLVGIALMLVAAVLAICVILKITKAQEHHRAAASL
ncbi:DUF4328 domain-containing protein [Nonomuraea diastatica]|nr:DUF4328 domain-containing protein [Nonomuraea diastatica]